MPPGAKIITVSDSAYRGEREDRSGPAVVALLEQYGFDVVERRVVPDGADPVATMIRDLAVDFAGAILTTGGTGFAPTDQTPEGLPGPSQPPKQRREEPWASPDPWAAPQRWRSGTGTR